MRSGLRRERGNLRYGEGTAGDPAAAWAEDGYRADGLKHRRGADPGGPGIAEGPRAGVRWQRMLDDGRYGSISEMAAAEKIERGYLGKVLKLTLLAPAMVEAIVDGRQGDGVTLPGLMDGVPNGW